MSAFVSVLGKYDDYVGMPQGATADDIASSEAALGLTFASEYVEYTKEVGAACADGHEFTGVVKSPRLNVVSVTKEAKEKNPNVIGGLYVVESLDVDGILIWQDKDGKVYESEYKGVPKLIATSLVEYIDM